jgi:hypothetical protein
MARVQCAVKPTQSDANGVMATAFKGGKGRLVVVLVNLSKTETRCTLGGHQTVNVYTTEADTNLKHSTQNAAQIELPARSVVTVVKDGR